MSSVWQTPYQDTALTAIRGQPYPLHRRKCLHGSRSSSFSLPYPFASSHPLVPVAPPLCLRVRRGPSPPLPPVCVRRRPSPLRLVLLLLQSACGVGLPSASSSSRRAAARRSGSAHERTSVHHIGSPPSACHLRPHPPRGLVPHIFVRGSGAAPNCSCFPFTVKHCRPAPCTLRVWSRPLPHLDPTMSACPFTSARPCLPPLL